MGQITLEHSYFTNQKQFYFTDIGNNNCKYVIVDSSGVSIYNLNHSLYLHFIPALPIWQEPHLYSICYITNSLFDCDSTTLEYAITNAGDAYSGFYVYRTDGTLLFSKSNASGPYCYGCADGSIVIRPIENTPKGTKLFLLGIDSTWVYSLCGTLSIKVDEHLTNSNYVKVFPNPTTGIINFEIHPPNNLEKFKLTIYNSLFQVIEETIVNGRYYQLDLNNRSLSSGTYLFDLRTEQKVFQTGKFILTK